MEEYAVLRKEVLASIDAVAAIADRLGSTAEAGRLREVGDKLSDGRFDLVVLGQFKRGKSTLINALLGQNLLPTAVVPLTSIVTVIEYGDRELVEVHFTDGRKQRINPRDLFAYVTETGNPGNRLRVARVTIQLPSPLLTGGIRIVDTPGIGSVYRHNTTSAYEFLPSADAAIFVLGFDPPITEAEREFLRAAGRYAAKIVFVLNKVDQVAEAEQSESLAFTKRVLEDALGRDGVVVFPLAARLGLEAKLAGDAQRLALSRLPTFEHALLRFVLREKAHLHLRSAAAKAVGAVAALRLRLELQASSLRTPIEELERKIDLFEERLAALTQRTDEIRLLLRARIDELVNRTLVQRIAAFQEERLPVLLQGLEQHAQSNRHLDTRAFGESLQDWVDGTVRETFNAWLAAEEGWLRAEVEAILGSFSRELAAMVGQAAAISAELFGTPALDLTVRQPAPSVGEFTFNLESDPTTLNLAVRFFVSRLPRPLAQRQILQDARTRLAELFDRHCGRGRYSLAEKVKAIVEQYRHEQETAVATVIDGLRAAVHKGLEAKWQGEEKIEQQRSLLAEQLAVLAAAEQKLREIQMRLDVDGGTDDGHDTNAGLLDAATADRSGSR